MTNTGKIALKLKELRERASLSTQQVADALSELRGAKVSKSTYTHYESKKFKQSFLPVALAKDLANIFKGVPTEEILALAGIEPVHAPDPKGLQGENDKTFVASQNNKALTFAGEIKLGPKDLPILGYVKAGAEGVFIDNGEVQGVTNRPDSLMGVSSAYAVRVHEGSMIPALQPGWLVHVDPYRPCRPGDLVVVQMKDGAAYLKFLVRRTEKHIICRQLNPEGEVRYETAHWRATHRVVGAKFLED